MATFKSYLTGFILSITLTLVAYGFVYSHVSSAHVNFINRKKFSFVFVIHKVLLGGYKK